MSSLLPEPTSPMNSWEQRRTAPSAKEPAAARRAA